MSRMTQVKSLLFSHSILSSSIFTRIHTLHSAIVEIYLQFVIKPFLEFHDIFYASLNKFFRSQLDAKKVPVWFTGMCRELTRTFSLLARDGSDN